MILLNRWPYRKRLEHAAPQSSVHSRYGKWRVCMAGTVESASDIERSGPSPVHRTWEVHYACAHVHRYTPPP